MASDKRLKELSIFFPLYNEEKNIVSLVEEAMNVFPKFADKFEVILVNDGSTDKTKEIGEKLEKKYKEVRLVNQKNKGYGGAIKKGFEESKYDWVFYSDGDLQFNLSEIKNLIPYINDYDLIIGYRKKRAEGLKRQLIAKSLKVWNKIFLNFPLFIKDIDCAFKLIRQDVINKIGSIRSNGGFVTTELLLKAHKNGLKIKQIGVTHKKRKFGKSTGSNPKVILKAIKETFQLRRTFGKNDILTATSIGIFLLFLPLANSINYLQNDEYTYYRLVQNFLQGKFYLDPYIGATFYIQGFLGTIWAKIFGIEKLEILTLLASVLTFFFFTKILNKHLKRTTLESLLLGGFLLLNPLFVYSSFGFMTENYFSLFLVLSIYFILEFDVSKKPKDFLIANLFIILGYFVRQLSFVTSIAFFFYLLFTKRYKYATFQLIFFISLWLFHYNIFPITPQMYDKKISLEVLWDEERTVSLLYILLIYFAAFTIPLTISFIKKRISLLLLILAIPMFIFLTKNFKPEKIYFTSRTLQGAPTISYTRGEFPYLDNIFGRKGFLQEDIVGDKYHYPGYFDLFVYWDIVSKILVSLFVIAILLSIKRSINFFSIFFGGYILLLLITPKIYDRYLLPLILSGILMVVFWIKRFGKLEKLMTIIFLVFFSFLDYLYMSDFYLVNKYIWGEAERIVNETGKDRGDINVNHSWRMLYPYTRENKRYDYVFKYDPLEKQPRDIGYFEIINEHRIKFPFNIYINPTIYTYRRIVPVELDTR